MPSTGTYLFHPELAELVDDAFEQAGIDPAKLTARHLRSAARSANMMMGAWFSRGYKQWTMGFVSQPLIAGQTSFLLPEGGWDIFHAMLVKDDVGVEMMAISRTDHSGLNNKTLSGRPDRYFVDRTTFLEAQPASTVQIYPVADQAYTMDLWYIRRTEDIGDPSNTLDLPWHWNEAFTIGLAERIAVKYSPDRVAGLHARAEKAFAEAMTSEREIADTVFSVSSRVRGRR